MCYVYLLDQRTVEKNENTLLHKLVKFNLKITSSFQSTWCFAPVSRKSPPTYSCCPNWVHLHRFTVRNELWWASVSSLFPAIEAHVRRDLTWLPQTTGLCSFKPEIKFGKGMALQFDQFYFNAITFPLMFQLSVAINSSWFCVISYLDPIHYKISSHTFPQEFQGLLSSYFVLLE